jgi:hypothetical protein
MVFACEATAGCSTRRLVEASTTKTAIPPRRDLTRPPSLPASMGRGFSPRLRTPPLDDDSRARHPRLAEVTRRPFLRSRRIWPAPSWSTVGITATSNDQEANRWPPGLVRAGFSGATPLHVPSDVYPRPRTGACLARSPVSSLSATSRPPWINRVQPPPRARARQRLAERSRSRDRLHGTRVLVPRTPLYARPTLDDPLSA